MGVRVLERTQVRVCLQARPNLLRAVQCVVGYICPVGRNPSRHLQACGLPCYNGFTAITYHDGCRWRCQKQQVRARHLKAAMHCSQSEWPKRQRCSCKIFEIHALTCPLHHQRTRGWAPAQLQTRRHATPPNHLLQEHIARQSSHYTAIIRTPPSFTGGGTKQPSTRALCTAATHKHGTPIELSLQAGLSAGTDKPQRSRPPSRTQEEAASTCSLCTGHDTNPGRPPKARHAQVTTPTRGGHHRQPPPY